METKLIVLGKINIERFDKGEGMERVRVVRSHKFKLIFQ